MSEVLQKIYVALLDEGTEVWRPVEAVLVGDNLYRIISKNQFPDSEHWEFTTGEIVRCEQKVLMNGLRKEVCLVAIGKAQ